MPDRNVARGMSNTALSVFRAHRYAPDHSGFPGKGFDPARYAELNQQYAGRQRNRVRIGR